MPVYLLCPHCEHPQVISPRRRGKTHCCRQCGRAYKSSMQVTEVAPQSAASIHELRGRRRQTVYVIDA